MGINTFSPGLQHYVNLIKAGDPFTFIRYGDGEWSAILGDRRATGSGSQRLDLPGLRKQMKASIIQTPHAPNYISAMRASSLKPAIATWLRNNAPPHIRWHDCTVFYKASKKGQLNPFIQALRGLEIPIILVGPERLKRIDGKVFPVENHIVIPGQNCWADKGRILLQMMSITEPAFYTISAGPAGKVLAWQLYRAAGQRSFIFDLGSLWDPYVGKASRRYHRGMLRRRTEIKANLRGPDA